jgi:threonine/homoserine/homoserine lactone efflux protein
MLVSQQTLANGRRAGLLCSIGIALGQAVHITYSALGLSALVAGSSRLLWTVKLLGGGYLIYLGVKGLRTTTPTGVAPDQPRPPAQSTLSSVRTGFMCNALNPKSPIYFLALFTVVIPARTPMSTIALCGAVMMTVQLLWFSVVALFLSIPAISRRFQRFGHWLDRGFGIAMILLGLRVLTVPM